MFVSAELQVLMGGTPMCHIKAGPGMPRVATVCVNSEGETATFQGKGS